MAHRVSTNPTNFHHHHYTLVPHLSHLVPFGTNCSTTYLRYCVTRHLNVYVFVIVYYNSSVSVSLSLSLSRGQLDCLKMCLFLVWLTGQLSLCVCAVFLNARLIVTVLD